MSYSLSTCFQETKKFLIDSLRDNGISEAEKILDKYKKPKPVTEKCEFFQRLIHHSYNRQMGPNVVGRILATKSKQFSELLFGYEAKKVAAEFGPQKSAILLKTLQAAKIAPENSGRYWATFSRSIVDAAAFIETIDDLRTFVAEIGVNEFSTLGAINLIQANIHGYGQALAADVLKECGFIDSVKPDTHIKKLAELISLNYRNDTDLLIKLNRDCLHSNLSPYEFDKYVWLVFSRGFYEDKGMKVHFNKAEYRSRIAASLNLPIEK
jgi:hypothetical protein